MKKRKLVNIIILKKIMSSMLVMTLVFGLVTTAELFYPTQENMVKAATFAASGSGINAPVFNLGNFPLLDNNDYDTLYYYGKEGNAFYGVTNGTRCWELVDTDAEMGGTKLNATWGGGNSGQQILNETNDLLSSHFNEADKSAMKRTDIVVNTHRMEDTFYDNYDLNFGTGSFSGAYLWPLKANQLMVDNGVGYNPNLLAGKLYQNINEIAWTRTYAGAMKLSSGFVSCYGVGIGYSGDNLVLRSYENGFSRRVAPAFNLDLTKVLIARSATSDTTQTSLSSAEAVSGDLKFLINAGTDKSSFNVPSINGKNLTNVFAGTTYSFDYIGASTGQVNGGINYVSAILYDNSGRVAYYGNIGTISASSGKADITIPAGLSGTYTLALFQEEKCEANKTDYASDPVYSKFTVIRNNYETNAEISSTQSSIVEVGETISNEKFVAKVSYKDGTTKTGYVYLIPTADFEKLSDKRTVKTTSVTVPKGSSSFKVTAVFIPEHTDTKSYWSKEFTYNINYEKAVSFSTTHGSSFSLNDTIKSSEFEGTVSWLNGAKTSVSSNDLYIIPTSVWGSGMSKEAVASLDKYNGGKSIKIDSSELKEAQSYSITVVYFPTVSGSSAYYAQNFEFASSVVYTTAFKAAYIGDDVEYGELLTDEDFSGRYVLSDGDKTEVDAAVKYILPTDVWTTLSDDVKANETELKKIKDINSIVIPNASDLIGKEKYSITVVYYDYSEHHSYGGGVNAGDCNYYAADVEVPLNAISKEYASYTSNGITWNYQIDNEGNAVNVYTLNENINQVIDKNGVFKIPDKIDGYTVKSIGTGIKMKPFIPSNINSYSSIDFPDTLTDINDYAFYESNAFVRLEIPSYVSNIGNFAFYNCDNLYSVKITSAELGVAAFGNCDKLIEVFVDGTGVIGKVAFAECSNLARLSVEGKFIISKNAFANDNNISTVNLKKITESEIESYAFKDCIAIKELYIPTGNIVDEYAFSGCTGLKRLELDIEEIKNHSFEGCYGIEYLIFGKNVSTVKYNWGGYSVDTYSSNNDYTDIIDTTLYVKNMDTHFETRREGEEYYSSLMGHYITNGSHKYSRHVNVYMSKETSLDCSIHGTSVSAVINCYKSSQNDVVEGGNTYKAYYTANGLLDVTFDIDDNIDDKTVDKPSVRDGIMAYYNGKVYDNAKVDKSKVIVKPTYSDAASAKAALSDFNFYAEDEVDAAIRAWIKSTDYSYKNVIAGKLTENKEYSYSEYAEAVVSKQITAEDFEEEHLAMIQSIFDNKDLFLTATSGVINNPVIYKLDEDKDYVIQHMNVIYYPNKDADKDADYNSNEPTYYITTFDVKVVKYTDEMFFFDEGFTYETAAKEIKELQGKIAELEAYIKRLENSNGEYSNELEECKQKLNQYIDIYKQLLQDLNDYIGSTTVEGNGYFGTKTEKDKNGNDIVIKVVWINGTECIYEKKGDTITVDEVTYDIYVGTGDIDGDGVTDEFDFYVASDGVHIIILNGEKTDIVYSDPIKALERKLAAQLMAIRNQLSGISDKIEGLKKALGIEEAGFDDLPSEEKLGIILEEVKELLKEKSELQTKIKSYEDAVEQIYQQLISGTLDDSDVSTLHKKLTKILTDIESIQTKNKSLSKKIEDLETEIKNLKQVVSEKDDIITQLEKEINGFKKIINEQIVIIDELTSTVGRYVLTLDDAAALFGISKDASVEEVKNAINAFVATKIEYENTIKAIQRKLKTTATGDALVALIDDGENQNTTVSPTPVPTKKEMDDVVSKKKYNSVLEKNAALESANAELSKKVTSLINKTENVKPKNVSTGKSSTVRTIYVTPSPTFKPGNSGRITKSTKTKGKKASPSATKSPLNTAEISSGLVSTDIKTLGTVVTRELPAEGNDEDLKGLGLDSSYVGIMKSNGSKDSESTVAAKKNANTIFAYYATHLNELANLGSEEIRECINDPDKEVSVAGFASIDVTPSEIQKKAMKDNKKLSLSLYSDKFINGNMYLIVHESMGREGKYDVALTVAKNGSIDIELEDLSPVSVAEIGIKDSLLFDGDVAEMPMGENADNKQDGSSNGMNGMLKILFIILGIAAVTGGGSIVYLMKKQKRAGSLKRRN